MTTATIPATITERDTLNSSVAHFPATLPVLQRFGLDTCCGGSLELRTAAAHHGLDLMQLITALEATIGEERPA